MKIEGDNYKGIYFVRISSLPEDQKVKIKSTFDSHRVIKILKEKELMRDCIQYADYTEWYYQHFNTTERVAPAVAPKRRVFIPGFNRRTVLG